MKLIAIEFTPAELRGLADLAGEGAAGLLTDPAAAQAYVGNKTAQAAAQTALDKVQLAASMCRKKRK